MNRKSFLKTLLGAIAAVPFTTSALPYREGTISPQCRKPINISGEEIFFCREDAALYSKDKTVLRWFVKATVEPENVPSGVPYKAFYFEEKNCKNFSRYYKEITLASISLIKSY